ncbi:protein dispatched homolog 1-like [Xyrauchen texanus]|uniref:protein dispatched homolog 1-like n=1 Tax=Xyrauchen texanus TaxID=154827 RepID=UPI002241DFCD|nr:protein dispatched homolog 1-like [Xyrauchen texanus]XP_051952054.1 protein dispatched homolog 1-like [Xyrauchen texanus]XP_051952055.1 protein dispatched homolog 1-like [Xyrauchen texanus]
MALSEGSDDLRSLSNGGHSTGASDKTFPATNANEDTEEDLEVSTSNGDPTYPNEQIQPEQSDQRGRLKTNGTVRPSSSGSASSSSSVHGADSQRLAVLLPNSLPTHCCACCAPRQPVCCNGNQQDCALFQSAVPAAPLHMGLCGVQGVRCFCMQHQWQEHLQNPPNMTTLSPPRPFRFPKSYAELIADWPVVVLGVCTVLIVICALVGILVPDLPDFSNPLQGFEPRGTAIGQRLLTWNNMVKNTGYKATLANYPFKYADEQAKSHQDDRWSEDHYDRKKRQAEWDFSKDSFFCDVPGDSYSRIVFASAEGKNLWNIQAIKSMCNFDNTRVRSHPQYLDLCQRTTAASCCPSWTLGNYIAVLTNKSSCHKITERDVSHTLKILRSCAKYYHNGTLGPECWDINTRKKDLKCGSVPRKCTKYNAVYQIFHFLVDKDFLNPKNTDYLPPNLKYSMLFSPTEKGETMMNIYLDNFENCNSSDGITTITGIEFGIKHNLFQDYLLTDTMYPAIAIVIVLVVMCVYTRSMFITLMTMFAIISSLIVSYFLYRVVFNFDFFPFMNLTALIILVGIGADDAFVLCDVWNFTKFDKPNSELSENVSVTLQHAALSMFVTSFTTAAAFYANYVSNITAIRCFGVYAGTAILVNYILMVTWLPAVVVLHERYLVNLFTCSRLQHQQTSGNATFWTNLCQTVNKCLFAISEASGIFFDKVLPCIVIKLRYLWLLWFMAMTVGGAYVVCVNPKMKLPSLELSEFQVFRSSHPFERYDAEYKKLFMFERVNHGEDLHMPITIIWGVNPVDNGDPLNPKNKGKLTLDTTFNIANPASQMWILNFCQKLRNQSFVFQSEEQDFTSCFMETFKQWMENQDCDEASVYPCCSQSTFPYKQDVFELCIKRAIMELDRSTIYHLDSKTPGPRFDINDTIRAIVLEFQSTYHFTLAYEKMHQFYKEVDAWIEEELKDAPDGLSYGWFVSNLDFYDLQDSLSDGTLIAMALSVVVAFSVMLLTTWNIIISLYAIISIAGTIFVTVGSLVLLGWELNVLESVTISVAVGLSVDFAVHYGIAYRLAPEPDREGKVVFSLSRMGSAIAMAALTTFVAGAMMMPSTVLAYTQLGTFLMLIMCISWAFATFFFQCMCRCLGPQGTCGQIPLPKKLQCYAFTEHVPETQSNQNQGKLCYTSKYQMDSSRGEGGLEHYELEPLALNIRNDSKANNEDQQACTQLHNGVSHHATLCAPNSDPREPIHDLDNGLPGTELQHLHPYTYSTSCSCKNVMPLYVRDQQRTPYNHCNQSEETQCKPLATNHLHVRHNPQSTRDWANNDCYMNCSHIHHCSQSPTSRQANHRCFPGGYNMHAVQLLRQTMLSDASVPEESNIRACGLNSPLPESLHLPDHIQCCATADSATVCTVNHDAGDQVLSSQSPQKLPLNHVKTKVNGTCVLKQDSRETQEHVPVVPEESAKCNQNSKENNERVEPVSPKIFSCFKKSVKVKCNSVEYHKPKTSVPTIAIHSKASSESLC